MGLGKLLFNAAKRGVVNGARNVVTAPTNHKLSKFATDNRLSPEQANFMNKWATQFPVLLEQAVQAELAGKRFDKRVDGVQVTSYDTEEAVEVSFFFDKRDRSEAFQRYLREYCSDFYEFKIAGSNRVTFVVRYEEEE